MNKYRILLYILAAALLCSCGKPDATVENPLSGATSDEVVTSETTPTETTLTNTTTAPTTEVTVPSVTSATETTTLTQEAPLLTLPTVPDPTQSVTVCGHNYQPSFAQSPTCEQAGYHSYRCQKCGDVQQQLSAPLGHSYSSATCLLPQQCNRCGSTIGSALGHQYEGGICKRCGEKDPLRRTITIQVKDNKNAPIDGVSVELHIADALHSTAVSTGGRVTFTLQNHSGSYKLVLAHIPEGYKARKDSYLYSSDSGAIVLERVPVVRPDDHSKAAYKVGSTMGEFTLTDVDGKTYRLSHLLQEKKLVILNFWYYTCIPCKAEFPYFNTIYQRYGNDIELLALNHFDSEAQMRQLRSEMGLSFPLATEHLGMQQGFGITSYPVTVFIGPGGRILHIQKDVGFQSEAELDTLVRQMIGK